MIGYPVRDWRNFGTIIEMEELDVSQEILETNRRANEEFAKAAEIYSRYVNNVWDTLIDLGKVLFSASLSGLVAVHVVDPKYIQSIDWASNALIGLSILSALTIIISLFFKMKNLAPAIEFSKDRMGHIATLAVLERKILMSARGIDPEVE